VADPGDGTAPGTGPPPDRSRARPGATSAARAATGGSLLWEATAVAAQATVTLPLNP
jgi:hypothetical protein